SRGLVEEPLEVREPRLEEGVQPLLVDALEGLERGAELAARDVVLAEDLMERLSFVLVRTRPVDEVADAPVLIRVGLEEAAETVGGFTRLARRHEDLRELDPEDRVLALGLDRLLQRLGGAVEAPLLHEAARAGQGLVG